MAAVVFDGSALGRLRLARGLSREALAVEIDRSFSLVQKFEAGSAAPSLETLRRLTAALGCSADELLKAPETVAT